MRAHFLLMLPAIGAACWDIQGFTIAMAMAWMLYVAMESPEVWQADSDEHEETL